MERSPYALTRMMYLEAVLVEAVVTKLVGLQKLGTFVLNIGGHIGLRLGVHDKLGHLMASRGETTT